MKLILRYAPEKMKGLHLAAYCFLLFIFLACTNKGKQASAKSNVTCMDAKIESFTKTACPNAAAVKQYEFQNKIVFAFEPGNCGADMTTEILDANCKSLGFLGGITGNTKINNEDFSKAVYQKTVWERASNQ